MFVHFFKKILKAEVLISRLLQIFAGCLDSAAALFKAPYDSAAGEILKGVLGMHRSVQ